MSKLIIIMIHLIQNHKSQNIIGSGRMFYCNPIYILWGCNEGGDETTEQP